MGTIFLVFFIIVILSIAYQSYRNSRILKRENLIDTFQFPHSITERVIEKYPHLSQQEAAQVINGLREYFHVSNIAGRRMVSMPSQAVDVAWHEFILFTKQYEQFCNKAFGRFLHHTPSEAMKSQKVAQAGIQITWRISCYREKIAPKSAHKLPLLFALDAKLNIPDGFKYSLNCSTTGDKSYCASHIGCSSGCGGSTSNSSGCGSGCGGD